MCGILGYVNVHIEQKTFCDALENLRHRGPDAGGTWFDGCNALGHRRLSIIDLSENGNQPMPNEDKTIYLTANGEIYNFKELRNILCSKKHIFRSDSDCEVLIHGYEEWGIEGLLSRIRGMFAFAIYDKKTDRLILARDFAGIKPLYYWHSDNRLAFASELSALRLIVPEKTQIDDFARDSYFTFGYIPGNLSIYRNCFKLLPCSYIEFKNGRISVRKYWSPPLPNDTGTSKTSIEKLHNLLISSVEEELVSDRPLGVFLSGGIDSSLVAAIASKKSKGIKTFTVGFNFQKYDESSFAADIAAYLGTDHKQLNCSEKDAIDMVSSLPDLYGEPFADSSAIPTFLLCKLAREHVVVAISGDGGDELCLGYNNYQDAWKISLLQNIPLRKMIGSGAEKILPVNSFPGKLAKAMQTGSVADACLLSSGMFHSLFFERLRGKSFNLASSYWHELFMKTSGVSLPSAWAWVDLQHFLVEDILTKVDRASMRNSLEVRVPLLSHNFIEGMMSLDEKEKLHKKYAKKALKQMLSTYLPAKLWDRPKQGFSPPLSEWLKGPLNEMLHDYLSKDRINREGILNSSFISKLIGDHESGMKENQSYLWNILMWEMWRDYAGF